MICSKVKRKAKYILLGCPITGFHAFKQIPNTQMKFEWDNRRFINLPSFIILAGRKNEFVINLSLRYCNIF